MVSYSLRKQPVATIYSGFAPIESPLLPSRSFSARDLFCDVMSFFETPVPSERLDRRQR
jgi:hypothetical protein